MEPPISQLPPGDTRLVDAIVNQLKSRGIFDKFRKECLADVDTKPAFQNLRQRVDGHVKKFLGTKQWKSDMNKNQIRDGVRKDIQESGILDTGIDAIINQVVNPKITPLILPYVEDTVYSYLQIEKPKRELEDDHRYGENQVISHPGEYNQNSLPYHVLPPHLQKNVYSDPLIITNPKINSEPTVCQNITVKKEESKELKTEVIPMATDAISSEEDDTLLNSNENAAAAVSDSVKHQNASYIKMEEDNAVDSFDSARNDCEMVASAVEKLTIVESESYSNVCKSEGMDPRCHTFDQQQLDPRCHTAIFDQQSLDSISSNSTNLSFSPQSNRRKMSGVKDSAKDDISMDELRSSQSTPLEDEKSASSQTSAEQREWSGSALPKDLPTSERIAVASYGNFGSISNTPMVVSGASPVSAESQSSLDTSPKVTSETALTEDTQESISQPKLGLDEVSSSTSRSSSRHSTPREPDSNSDKGHSSKSSSTDDKSRKRSQHNSKRRESTDQKDRHHSKSRDDHSSHRKKDKYRKDRDDDSDKDHNKGRYHSSSSSHHYSSSHSSAKDRRGNSSSHSSSHKSNKHGKSHRSDHHRRRDSGEKSSRRDSIECKSKSDDSKDKSKSSYSINNAKVVTYKVNGVSSNVPVNNLLFTNKKSRNNSGESSKRQDSNKKSSGINNDTLKRNGSFAQKNIINGTKEKSSNKNITEKDQIKTDISSAEKNINVKPKRLLALEEDITLMGNLNKKKKIIRHKISREPNNNNGNSDTVNESKVINKPINNEYQNGKKLKENTAEKTNMVTNAIEESKSVKNTFPNGKIPKRKLSVTESITNEVPSVCLKKTLTVSLEDISPRDITRKRRKIEKSVIIPPTNSQRLVICSFNADAKVLKQSILDDSEDGSDFEGFEPQPKRFCIDASDMFAESDSAILFDFEGFPDTTSPGADNKVRNYLARMNHTGNCSRYSD